VLQSYGTEIRSLHHVVIDERIGVGLLLQLADTVIAPFAGTTTERAALCRKPTIVFQAMGQEGWRGEFLYWETRPEKIPDLVRTWHAKGWLQQMRLARVVASMGEKGETSSRAENVSSQNEVLSNKEIDNLTAHDHLHEAL